MHPSTWGDAGNWSDNQVPGAGDEAIIGPDFNVFIDGNFTVGSLVLSGAIYNSVGSLTITSSFSWSQGSVSVPIFLLDGSSSLWTGSLGLAAPVENHGDLTCSANIGLSYYNIVNYGTFNAPGTHSINTVYAPAGFINHGILKKPSIGGGTFSFGILVTNETDGQILVQADTLYPALHFYDYGDAQISAGAVLRSHTTDAYAPMIISGAGQLLITGNGMTMNDDLTFDVQDLVMNSNGLAGTHTLTIPNHFQWVHGSLGAPIHVTSSGTFDVTNGEFHILSDVITIDGASHLSSDIAFASGTIVNNGNMEVSGNTTLGIYVAPGTIENYGTITKPAGDAATFTCSIDLKNMAGGQIYIQDGTFNEAGNTYNHAAIDVSAPATYISFNLFLYDGAAFTGAGKLIIGGNGMYPNNASPVTFDIAQTEINASSSYGTGETHFKHHFQWINGTLQSPMVIDAGGTLDVSSGSSHGLASQLTVNGTMNINADITFSGGTITNNGYLTVSGAHTMGIYTTPAVIENYGTLVKPSGDAATFTFGAELKNMTGGQVLVQGGVLNESYNTYNHASIDVSDGARFNTFNFYVYDNSTFTGAGLLNVGGNGLYPNNILELTFDIQNVEWECGGFSAGGPLMFNHAVNWKTASLGCPVTIATGGTLDLTTAGNHSYFNDLTINGTMNVGESYYAVGTLYNNGVLNYNAPVSVGYGLIYNTGTIHKPAGIGDVTVNQEIHNSGTIECLGENLFLGGLVNSGVIDAAAGANVELDQYDSYNSFDAGTSLTGMGSFTMNSTLSVNADLTADILNFNLDGYYSLTGTGTLKINNAFNWLGAQIENTVLISTSGTMNITAGPNPHALYGTVVNQGTVNCASDVPFSGNFSTFSNSGIFHLTGDNTLGGTYYSIGVFNNSGVLYKSSYGTASLNLQFNNEAGAALQVILGTLVAAELNNSGSVSIAPVALLRVKGGNEYLSGTVAGTGTLHIEGNGWTIQGNFVAAGFSLEIDGNLDDGGNGALDIQHTASWTSGAISIPVTVDASGILDITGYGYKLLQSTLNNAGTVNCSTSVTINGNIDNSGNLYLNNGAGLYSYSSYSLTNTGLVKMDDPNFDSYIYFNTLNNGTVEAVSKALHFYSGLTNNNVLLSDASSAMLDLNGDNYFNPASSFSGSGSLSAYGSLTLGNNFTFTGNTFTLDADLIGPGTVTNTTTMIWNNGNVQTNITNAGGATLNIGGGNGGGGGGGGSDKPGTGNKINSYGQGLTSAIIANDGTANQYTSYFMDNGTFNNSSVFTNFGGGITNGGNGGALNNNGDWTSHYNFDCYVPAYNNGTFEGDGYYLNFEPNLTNPGIVKPGSPIGQMVYYHSYTNGSELDMDMDNAGGQGQGYDYIEALDSLYLSGNLIVTETGNLPGGTYTILKCDGGPTCRTGMFDNATLPSGYSLSYTDDAVLLTKTGGQQASISPADTTVCAGSPVVLTASAGDAYLWSTGESSQSITVNPTVETTYTVTVTYPGGSTSSASAIVHVNPLPVVSLTLPDPNCYISGFIYLTGGTPEFGTFSGPGVSGGFFDPTSGGLTAGNYILNYTFTDGNGCQATATDTMTVDTLSLNLSVSGPGNVDCQTNATYQIVADSGFVDLAGLQFGINWDPTKWELVSYAPGTLPSSGTVDFNACGTVGLAGYTVTFDDGTFYPGVTLAPGTVLGSITLKALTCNATTGISLTDITTDYQPPVCDPGISQVQIQAYTDEFATVPVYTHGATVSLEDHTAPTFTRPADITVYSDANCNYDASLAVTGDVTDEADNCSTNLDATYSDVVTTGACEGTHVITRTWHLEDNCGNVANQIQTITVADNIAPTFTRPADITIYTDDNCNYDASVAITGDVSDEADNCSTNLNATYSDVVTAGACEGTHIITRTWHLIDHCGNAAANQVQTITVNDEIAPTFTLPADITIYTDANCNYNASVAATGDVTDEHDNCSTNLNATFTDIVTAGACEGTHIITRTWHLTDHCGNPAANQVQTITILDNTAPTFTRPADVTIHSDGNCNYNASVAITGDVLDEHDNCSTELNATFTDVTTNGSCEGAHIITRTWHLADHCGNAAADQVQTITITDNIPPTFTRPADITVYTDASCNYNVSIGLTGDVTNESDNCSTGLNATFTDVVSNGPCTGSHVITRTWHLADHCGNAAVDQVQTITVSDNTPPTAVCKNITVGLDASGSVSIVPAQVNNGSSDNCSTVTLVSVLPSSFTCANKGINTVTLTVKDGCNNQSQCNANVTVVDIIPPTVSCPVSVTKSPTNSAPCSAVVTGINASFSDNCTGANLNYTLSGATTGGGSGQASGQTFNSGTTTVTYKATDGSGSTATCSFAVTVTPCIHITGNILWENNNAGVKDAVVAITGSGTGSQTTNAAGFYDYASSTTGNFTLTPTKNINLLNGVTTADATRIQQHITGSNPLSGPYKRIAADVNKSNSITTLDATLIQQALLGNPQALAIFNTSWRFVPKSYVFPNPNTPWGFPESISLTGVTSSQSGEDFVGVKIGDVDGTANPQTRPLSPLVWIADDQVLQAGEETTVTFKASHFNDFAAFQFALNLDPAKATWTNVETFPTALDLTVDNFGAFDAANGILRSVWTKPQGLTLAEGTEVFRLKIKALQNGIKLSEILHLDDEVLDGIAFDTQLDAGNIQLVFRESQVLATNDPGQESKQPELLQNRPNPFTDRTVIGFILPEACEANIRIFDTQGRLVEFRTKSYPAGYQEETFQFTDTAAGILYYELTTPYGKAARKMVEGRR
jgi:hypothetical protein